MAFQNNVSSTSFIFIVTNSSNNGSFDLDNYNFRVGLKKACDVMTVAVLMLIMLSMGADILFKEIVNHLRRPVGIGVGMGCQFVVMPLIGFTLINSLRLEGANAIGLLLISCCPGGAVSNVFTYFLNGDVPLSVTMTSLSTLLALIFMPLNIWIYGIWIDVGQIVIPYKSMATSLTYVTSPACVGMVIRWKHPKASQYITKIGSIVGFIVIALIIILQNVAYPAILLKVDLKLVVAVVTMPAVGLTFGYCIAWTFKRGIAVRKTIAVECGIQNVAIAMAVLSLSNFSFEMQGELMLFPMMYGISMIGMCFVICLGYQAIIRIFSTKKKKNCKDEGKEAANDSEPKQINIELTPNINVNES